MVFGTLRLKGRIIHHKTKSVNSTYDKNDQTFFANEFSIHVVCHTLVACLANPIFVPEFDWSMSKIISLGADTKPYHNEQCVIQMPAVRKTKTCSNDKCYK